VETDDKPKKKKKPIGVKKVTTVPNRGMEKGFGGEIRMAERPKKKRASQHRKGRTNRNKGQRKRAGSRSGKRPFERGPPQQHRDGAGKQTGDRFLDLPGRTRSEIPCGTDGEQSRASGYKKNPPTVLWGSPEVLGKRGEGREDGVKNSYLGGPKKLRAVPKGSPDLPGISLKKTLYTYL